MPNPRSLRPRARSIWRYEGILFCAGRRPPREKINENRLPNCRRIEAVSQSLGIAGQHKAKPWERRRSNLSMSCARSLFHPETSRGKNKRESLPPSPPPQCCGDAQSHWRRSSQGGRASDANRSWSTLSRGGGGVHDSRLFFPSTAAGTD